MRGALTTYIHAILSTKTVSNRCGVKPVFHTYSIKVKGKVVPVLN